MKPLYIVMLALVLALDADGVRGEDDDNGGLTVFTEINPPHNFEEDGEPRGISVDILLAVFNRAGIAKQRSDIRVVPWARGYAQTLRRKNTLLFATTRTPERDGLFKWVGPIGIHRQVLMARRDANIAPMDHTRFNDYTFCVVRQSSGAQRLLAAGVSPDKFIYVNSSFHAAQLLARGRVDACTFERVVASWAFLQLGYSARDFETAYTFSELALYFALNKDTDERLVAALQAGLDQVRADGTMAAIVEGYLPGAAATFLHNSTPNTGLAAPSED